jgi:hypothetical protein
MQSSVLILALLWVIYEDLLIFEYNIILLPLFYSLILANIMLF